MNTFHLNQIDVARRWKMSPRTLERWRWLGKGPSFVKLGGKVVYRLQDIEAYEGLHLRSLNASQTNVSRNPNSTSVHIPSRVSDPSS